ncbi:MAG: (d)CMP kinase [Nanobdellota archaeon]
MIISISGTPGSGKSTVGKAIAKRLNLSRYYIGGILREQAKQRGLTLQQLLTQGETDPSIDQDVDKYQRELGKNQDNFVIEGRTSFIMIPQSIKIFLKTDYKTAAERIYNDKADRNEGQTESLEQMEEKIEKRMGSDRKRYIHYYGVDAFEEDNYDIVIDTSDKTPEQVIETVLERIRQVTSQSSL